MKNVLGLSMLFVALTLVLSGLAMADNNACPGFAQMSVGQSIDTGLYQIKLADVSASEPAVFGNQPAVFQIVSSSGVPGLVSSGGVLGSVVVPQNSQATYTDRGWSQNSWVNISVCQTQTGSTNDQKKAWVAIGYDISDELCSGFSRITPGQTQSAYGCMASNPFSTRLSSISSNYATFDVLSSGSVVGHLQISPNSSSTFIDPATGKQVQVQMCNAAVLTSADQRAWIRTQPMPATCNDASLLNYSVGQSVTAGPFQVRLDDVSSMNVFQMLSCNPANFSILQNGNVIGQVQVNPGETYTFAKSSTGEQVKINLCSTAYLPSETARFDAVYVPAPASPNICPGYSGVAVGGGEIVPNSIAPYGVLFVSNSGSSDTFNIMNGSSAVAQFSLNPGGSYTYSNGATSFDVNLCQNDVEAGVLIAHISVTPHTQPTCPSDYTGLTVGQVLSSTGPLKVRLSDVSVAVGSSNTHPAILDVLDANNQVIGQVQVSPGTTYTYAIAATGEQLQIQVCQTAGGFTSNAKWAFVKLNYIPAPQQNTCSGYTEVSLHGDIYNSGIYPQFWLDDVLSDGSALISARPNAGYTYQTSNDNIIDQFQLTSGSSHTVVTPSGDMDQVQVCSTQSNPKKAWVKITPGLLPYYQPGAIIPINSQYSLRLDRFLNRGAPTVVLFLLNNSVSAGQILMGTQGHYILYLENGQSYTVFAPDIRYDNAAQKAAVPTTGQTAQFYSRYDGQDKAQIRVILGALDFSGFEACYQGGGLRAGDSIGLGGSLSNPGMDDNSATLGSLRVQSISNSNVATIQVSNAAVVTLPPMAVDTVTDSRGYQVQITVCKVHAGTTADDTYVSTNFAYFVPAQRTASSTCSSDFTELNIGQTLGSPSGLFKIRLADIAVAVGSTNDHPAILDVLDSNDNLLTEVQVNKFGSYTYVNPSTGDTLQIQECRNNPGLTLASRWANVKLTYTPGSGSNYSTCVDGQKGPCTTPQGQLCDYHKLQFEGYYSSQYGCINACGLGNNGPCQCYGLVCQPGQSCNTQNGIQCVQTGSTPLLPPSLPDITTLSLHKGWNLVSLGATPTQFDFGGSSDASHKLLGFVYLQDEQKYVSILQAQQTLGNGFADYLGSHAFWIYSYSDTSLNVQTQEQSALDSMALVSGWNFVPLSQSVSQQTFGTASASCQMQRAYLWDASSQTWSSIGQSQVLPAFESHEGIVVKVGQACMIGNALTPPPLPAESASTSQASSPSAQ